MAILVSTWAYVMSAFTPTVFRSRKLAAGRVPCYFILCLLLLEGTPQTRNVSMGFVLGGATMVGSSAATTAGSSVFQSTQSASSDMGTAHISANGVSHDVSTTSGPAPTEEYFAAMEAAGPQQVKRRAKGKKVKHSEEEFDRTAVTAASPTYRRGGHRLTAEQIKIVRAAARKTRDYILSLDKDFGLPASPTALPLLSKNESVPSNANVVVLAVLGVGSIFFVIAILFVLVRRSYIRAKLLNKLKGVHKARQNGLSGEEEEKAVSEEQVPFNPLSDPDVSIRLGGNVP
eukprot:GHVS01071836.1.p1 GENE.GHVS01071836.1~~GHVS01071836.1.p1  ORF type:complete len:302 (+),score=27.40 GHVS01071836.1:43-906(+)